MKQLLFVCLFFPVMLWGQSKFPPIQSISLGLSFSPDYAYRFFSGGEQNLARNAQDKPRFSFTAGANVLLKYKDRFTMETGLLFNQVGGHSTAEYEDYYSDIYLVDVIYKYHYLNIPIKANMYLSNVAKRYKFFVAAGLSANIYLGQTSKTIYTKYDGTTRESNQSSSSSALINRVNVALLLGCGLDYALNEQFNLRLEPCYRQSIMPMADAPVKQYNYSIGLNVGLHYKIK